MAARKRIGKDLLHELADAWGFMIFQEVGLSVIARVYFKMDFYYMEEINQP